VSKKVPKKLSGFCAPDAIEHIHLLHRARESPGEQASVWQSPGSTQLLHRSHLGTYGSPKAYDPIEFIGAGVDLT
jgi:hypothetical protein